MSVAADQGLILRADADSRAGIGHVMRCLALAQAWQDIGGSATFAMTTETPALEARLKSERLDVVYLPSIQPGGRDDATQTAALAHTRSAAWVVVDGYHFGADYQRLIKEAEVRLLAIDDYGHAEHYYADLVLNQNIYAHEAAYGRRVPSTRLLLGTQFALLRREFLKWRGWNRQIPEVARKILVTLGGGDSGNMTGAVIRALRQIEAHGLEAVIVVGTNNPHAEDLASAARGSRIPIRLESPTVNMPELMAWADIAISAGGSTCWELAFMRLPNCIIVLAEHQRPVAERLHELGAAINTGWFGSLDEVKLIETVTQLVADQERRRRMSEQGKRVVNGHGSRCVVRAMLHHSEAEL